MFAAASPEERAQLKRQHAHRFPEIATLTVLDGAARIALPFVLGNPSGACEMPAGTSPTAAWALSCRAGFGLAKGGPALAQAIAADCILYPAPALYGRAFERWPDLARDVADEVARKVGSSVENFTDPLAVELPPAPVADALASRPLAAWRWYVPRAGTRYAVVLEPPTGPAWRIRRDALTRPNGDVWAALRALVEPSVVLVVREVGEAWESEPLGDTMRRWPGMAIGLSAALARLMGATGNADFSEL
jgi:hypothetical protein